jgi:5-methyltetrahydrofolate--homocysteine methyltransferase
MQGNETIEKITKAVVDGLPGETETLAKQAINAGMDPLDVIEDGLSRGIRIVGDRFGKGELFITDLMMSAEAMKSGLAILQPKLNETHRSISKLGTIVIGTVAGDIHDIGKTIVATMLDAAGFEVHDLGVDVATDTFVKKARELRAQMLGLSALLTVTTPRQKDVVEALVKGKLRKELLVIVGGGSVTQSWAEEVGADGYASDAIDAAKLARTLIDDRRKRLGH